MRQRASQAHYRRTVGIHIITANRQTDNREKNEEKVEDYFSNKRNSKIIYSKSYLSKFYQKVYGEHIVHIVYTDKQAGFQTALSSHICII